MTANDWILVAALAFIGVVSAVVLWRSMEAE